MGRRWSRDKARADGVGGAVRQEQRGSHEYRTLYRIESSGVECEVLDKPAFVVEAEDIIAVDREELFRGRVERQGAELLKEGIEVRWIEKEQVVDSAAVGRIKDFQSAELRSQYQVCSVVAQPGMLLAVDEPDVEAVRLGAGGRVQDYDLTLARSEVGGALQRYVERSAQQGDAVGVAPGHRKVALLGSGRVGHDHVVGRLPLAVDQDVQLAGAGVVCQAPRVVGLVGRDTGAGYQTAAGVHRVQRVVARIGVSRAIGAAVV